MKPRHPYEWLSTAAQKRAFIALLVLTLTVMITSEMPVPKCAVPLGAPGILRPVGAAPDQNAIGLC